MRHRVATVSGRVRHCSETACSSDALCRIFACHNRRSRCSCTLSASGVGRLNMSKEIVWMMASPHLADMNATCVADSQYRLYATLVRKTTENAAM